MVKVYLSQAMTGRAWVDLFKEASNARWLLSSRCDVYSPVLEEWHDGDPKADLCLAGPEIEAHWRRDKEAMVRCHVLLDLTPFHKSEGVAHEIGWFRYCVWKPVVRLMPGKPSIAWLEDDVLVETLDEAAREIQARWGTWGKRALWRVGMLWRSFPKWVWRQILAWS